MVGNYHKNTPWPQVSRIWQSTYRLDYLAPTVQAFVCSCAFTQLCIFVQCMCILNILSMLCILYIPLLGLGRITHPTRTRYYRSTLKSVVLIYFKIRGIVPAPCLALDGPVWARWPCMASKHRARPGGRHEKRCSLIL